MSGSRKIEDLAALRTRRLLLVNSDGSYPSENKLLAVSGDTGLIEPTNSIDITDVKANTGEFADSLTVEGRDVITAIQAGGGIRIDDTWTVGIKTVTNTGVRGIIAGDGIEVSDMDIEGKVTVTATGGGGGGGGGILSVIGGDGIEATEVAGSVTVTNKGVLSVQPNLAGPPAGIETYTDPSGNVFLTNTGVSNLSAGDGIEVNGSTGAVTVTNKGVLSISAGDGIDVSAMDPSGNVVITATGGGGGGGVTSLVAGDGIDVSSASGDVTVAVTGDQGGNSIVHTDSVTVGTGDSSVGSYALTLSADQSNAQIFMGKSSAPASGNGGVLSVNASYQLVYTNPDGSFVIAPPERTTDTTHFTTQTIENIPSVPVTFHYTISGGGGGGGGAASALSGDQDAAGGGGGGSGEIVSGSEVVGPGSVITYQLGVGGVGGDSVGQNGTISGDTAGQGASGTQTTLTINGRVITAGGGSGGFGGSVASGSIIGGAGGNGYFGGGGGLSTSNPGDHGIGTAASGGAAIGIGYGIFATANGGPGGGNGLPGRPYQTPTVVGGNGGGAFGQQGGENSVAPPESSTFGSGGAGGAANYTTRSVSIGGKGGDGYINYYYVLF